MADDAEAFVISLDRWMTKTSDRSITVIRVLALTVLKSLVMKSPVGNAHLWKRFVKGYVGGRFRGNWNVGLGNIDTSINNPVDAGGGNTIGRGLSVLSKAKFGISIWVTNSLPYSRRLEYGWSKQAPEGMVRITALEMGGPAVAANAVAKALQGLLEPVAI